MGMDVFGQAPRSKQGKYFRANIWSWGPIWSYCEQAAPELTAKVEHGYTNDGDGLCSEDASELGRILKNKLNTGEVARHVAQAKASIAAMSRETCEFCAGTGIRTDMVGERMNQPRRLLVCGPGAVSSTGTVLVGPGHPRLGQVGWCNGCNGVGSTEPYEAHYVFDEDRLREFAEFLQVCGGFRIF